MHLWQNRLFIPFVISFLAGFFLFTSGLHAQTKKFTGVVYDYDSHQPLDGITVSVVGKKYKALTDSAGKFTILLPVNEYNIVLTSIGYQRLHYRIHVPEQGNEEIFLRKAAVNELEEVIVENRKKDAAVKDMHIGTVLINPSQLKRTPLLFGEADIIKALTLQPGIITPNETVSGYSVRGGYTDQNLVLIDEAPIFNISHLLGIYTAISADAIQNTTFYKAGLPAQYGGRLSSIMLLNVNPGNPDTMYYNAGVGFISSHFFLNGPLTKKLTIMAGGRIAYPKIMMNLFPGSVRNSNAFFYDANIKLSYLLNANNRISVTLYNSYDKFKFPGDTSYAWKNLVSSFQWKGLITPKFSFHLIADYSKYTSYINGMESNYSFQLSNYIEQKQGKAVLKYSFNDNHQVTFGGELTRYTLQPGHLIPLGNNNIIDKKIESERAKELAGFISFENRITDFLQMEVGVRFTSYTYLGSKSVFLYNAGEPKTFQSIYDTVYYPANAVIKTYHMAEPRLLFRFLLNNSTSIKFAYNKTEQNLHLITNTYSITPVDYWKLSDSYIKPETADHYALGLYKNFNNNSYETSLEVYYKDMQNTVEYKNGADLFLNPALETQLLPAHAYAYGIEASMRKNSGLLTGLVSYTYSRTFTRTTSPFAIEQINNGNYFPGNIDVPHSFVLSGSVKLRHGWLFSSNFVYRTGRPATFPDGSYIINGTVVTNYSLRNQDRFPAYHRLDIAFSHDSRKSPQQKRYDVFNFSVYNVYGRPNVYSIYFIRDNNYVKSYRLSILASLVPTISWNFNF